MREFVLDDLGRRFAGLLTVAEARIRQHESRAAAGSGGGPAEDQAEPSLIAYSE